MTFEGILVLILLLGLVVASDKFEFIKEKTEKYQKIKEMYVTVIGLILFVIITMTVINHWNEIDWFQGRGGSPYGDIY